jgi:predicted DNA-binding transcriptional regulator YafY
MRADSEVVRVVYTNWKGETSIRHIAPIEIFFGSNEWHTEEQWLLLALDVDKGAERTFALKDIHTWKAAPRGTDVSPAKLRAYPESSSNGLHAEDTQWAAAGSR